MPARGSGLAGRVCSRRSLICSTTAIAILTDRGLISCTSRVPFSAFYQSSLLLRDVKLYSVLHCRARGVIHLYLFRFGILSVNKKLVVAAAAVWVFHVTWYN